MLCHSVGADPALAAPLDPSLPLDVGARKEPGEVVHGELEGVRKPEKIAGRPPRFTQRARRAGFEGSIEVEAVIDQEGCVRDAKVLSAGRKDMAGEVLNALRTWVFEPAEFKSKPSAVSYRLTATSASTGSRRSSPGR